MITCQKNPLCKSATPNKSDEFSALNGAKTEDNGATIKDNEALNILNFAILRSSSLDSGPTPIFILPSINKRFKLFI